MIDIEKYRRLLDEISAEKGEFVLFGLFLREEAPDIWDLVISAPWLEEGKLKALGEVAEKASTIVGKEEILKLSRIVTLEHDDPVLIEILSAFQVTGDPVEIKDSNLFGLGIEHAYILRASRDAELQPAAT